MSDFLETVKAVEKMLSTVPAGALVTQDTLNSVSSQMSKQHTFASLAEAASALDQTRQVEGVKAHLIALRFVVATEDSLSREEGDAAAIQCLCDAVAATIAPKTSPEGGGDESTSYEEIAQRSYELAPYGLAILSECVKKHAAILSEDALLTVIAFLPPRSSLSPAAREHAKHSQGSPAYPWVNLEAIHFPEEIILQQYNASFSSKEDILVETILKGYLRPMFSKSKPNTITQSGRKAEFPDEHDPHRALEVENSEVKPWKYADHRAIAVLAWAVNEAEEELISKQWPLFIPVLLTLVDDGSTRVRAPGLAILCAFLLKFPSNILRDTGLTSVFEDAILPTLHFLPSLTPEEESIQLLDPAYTALLTLAKKTDAKASSGQYAGTRTTKSQLLDKILRDGIFSAYFHAKEHIRIVKVLCLHMSNIIHEMGIHAVKHLKDLIPMHSEIMTNPFAPLAPDTLRAALESLHAILTNCWPRLSTPAYQDELIKMLVVCFINIEEESKDDLVDIKKSIIKTAAIFMTASKTADKGGDNLNAKVKPLIAQEPLLAALFKQT
ncbi:hypothetical protein BD289DRAFT_254770 [Coniella lustricola]|uniref:Armadillo-type protein n=1 Tax=Coniella lustricola TaxID=2025994 RepID=A0A2T3AKV0_9PEZI|nr:hypothetical protein BD289DRAFT_254770 [Coniella lustricola]